MQSEECLRSAEQGIRVIGQKPVLVDPQRGEHGDPDVRHDRQRKEHINQFAELWVTGNGAEAAFRGNKHNEKEWLKVIQIDKKESDWPEGGAQAEGRFHEDWPFELVITNFLAAVFVDGSDQSSFCRCGRLAGLRRPPHGHNKHIHDEEDLPAHQTHQIPNRPDHSTTWRIKRQFLSKSYWICPAHVPERPFKHDWFNSASPDQNKAIGWNWFLRDQIQHGWDISKSYRVIKERVAFRYKKFCEGVDWEWKWIKSRG